MEEVRSDSANCLAKMVDQNIKHFSMKQEMEPRQKPKWTFETFSPCYGLFDNILKWAQGIQSLRRRGDVYLGFGSDIRSPRDQVLAGCTWAKTDEEKAAVAAVKDVYDDCESLYVEKCGSPVDTARTVIERISEHAKVMLYEWEPISVDKPEPEKIKDEFLKHADHHKVPCYIGALETCIAFLEKYKDCGNSTLGPLLVSVPELNSKVKHQVAASGYLFAIYVTWFKKKDPEGKLQEFTKAKEYYSKMAGVLLPQKIVARLNNGISRLNAEIKEQKEATAKAAAGPKKKVRKTA